MARITYKTRFQSLIANPDISPSDLRFAKSLFASYTKAKGLTSGRRAWLVKLEEKYSADAMAARKEAGKAFAGRITELSAVLARIPGSESWEKEFMTSIVGQLENGRALTPKQESLIERVSEKYTDDRVASGRLFAAEFKAKHQQRFKAACEYYSQVGYFKHIVERSADPEYVPSEGEFEKVTDNKYAQKVLTEYFKDPKYPAGGMISFRSNPQIIKEMQRQPWSQRKATGNPNWSAPSQHSLQQHVVATRFVNSRLYGKIADGMAIILNDNAMVPISACKGARVYSVLPIGSTQPVLIEERYLKNPPKRAR
tara:strand:- start:51 stop:986 length:936 start_codon:yes stop_codon:yes gene_type:complete